MRFVTTAFACFLILGFTFVPTPAGAVGENLVPNPSFEAKSSATATMSDGWRSTNQFGFRSQLQSTEGGFSLGLVGGSSAAAFQVRSSTVELDGCGPMEFSFDADVVTGELRAVVEFRNSFGAILGTTIVDVAPNAGWERVSREIASVPSGATHVSFLFAVGLLDPLVAHVDMVVFTTSACTGGLFESWENGMGAWYVESGSGHSFDCSRASDGACSLRLAVPSCCGDYVRVTRDLAIPIGASRTLSFDFQGSSTGGDRNALIQVRTGSGAVNVDWTYGSNNGLNVINHALGSQSNTIAWGKVDNWYRVVVTIDGGSHTMTARMTDLSNGQVLGTTTPVAYTGNTLTGISVQQVMWSGSSNTHHVDRIAIE